MISIRPARADDHDVYARLIVEFGTTDPTPTVERFASHIVPTTIVAEAGGAVVGFAAWRPYGELAHFVRLVVDPAQRRRGYARALIDEVRRQAIAAGCTRWYLNVKEENVAARTLYASVGLAHQRTTHFLSLAWDAALALPRSLAEPFVVTPDDDALVGCGVNVLRIAAFRARGAILLGLRAQRGFTAFDPAFPGCIPFATSPGDAGALLAAARPYARPEFPYVRISVEGDDLLATFLRARGAELLHVLLELGGSLGGQGHTRP